MGDAEAVVHADLLLHAVEVILHGLLGRAEAVGDFFVGEPFGDQRNELLLAAREAEALMQAGAEGKQVASCSI